MAYGNGIYYPYEKQVEVLPFDFTMDHVPFTEEGKFLLYEHEFFPEDYCIGWRDDHYDTIDCIFTVDDFYTYNSRHFIDFIYEISTFQPSNVEIRNNPEPTFETKNATKHQSLNQLFKIEYGELAIKTLKIYVNIKTINPKYPIPEISISNINFTNLTIINPTYENKCRVDLYTDKYDIYQGDVITFGINGFYFGHQSQLIDIYLVFYNFKNLYFFPSMTNYISSITLYMPQYTMIRKSNIEIGAMNIDDFSPKNGLNIFYMGIAPTGTLNFFNEGLGEHSIYYIGQ